MAGQLELSSSVLDLSGMKPKDLADTYIATRDGAGYQMATYVFTQIVNQYSKGVVDEVSALIGKN